MVKGQELDHWICSQFKVLPTEDRFKRLGEEQKYLLFIGFLEQAQPDDIHRGYHSNKARLEGETLVNLKKMGYSDRQLARMKDQLEKAGI